jgi:hypothetical protein
MSWLNFPRIPSPRQGLALGAILLPQFLCAWTIGLGDSRSDVLKAYGAPPSKMVTAQRELFRYQEGELIIENGVVVDIRFHTHEPALLNQGFVKESRDAAPAPAPKVEKPAPAQPPAPPPAQPPSKSDFWENIPFSPLAGLIGIGLFVGLFVVYRTYRRIKDETEAAARRKQEIQFGQSPAPVLNSTTQGKIAFLTRSSLDRLEWRAFDELVRNYMNTQGWVTKRVRVDPNGTTRSLLWKRSEARPSAYLCCVPITGAWLDVEQVRQVEEILLEESLPDAFIITTGDFSSEARTHALKSRRVELVSGDALMSHFRNLPRKQHALIVSQAFTGDFETPSCPACEIKMVPTDEPKPRWVCPQQPTCRQSFPMAQAIAAVTSD